MSNTSSSSGGVGFIGALFLLFLGLKLGGVVIDWSWWWVTAPLWGIPALVVGIITIAVILVKVLGIKNKKK